MIPLLHDLSDETVLILGGGPIGARKARRFAREARVLVVSPAFCGDDFGGAERVRAAPGPEDVGEWISRTDPALVVAATDDPMINDAAEAAARDAGALVNRADERGARDAGSVVVPATARDGDVVAAVATGGRSPTVSKHLRRRLEDVVSGAETVAAATAEARAALDAAAVPPERRRRALNAAAGDPAVWEAARSDGSPEAVRRAVDGAIEAVLGENEMAN